MDIAHPDDRNELLQSAQDRGIVGKKQTMRSRSAYPLDEERDLVLRDGRRVLARPTRTSDRAAMQELFHRLPEEDVRTCFFHKLSSLTDAAAEHLCSVDYENEMAFAAVVGPVEHERIVAASCYYRNPATRLADVGYMVDPTWQGAGVRGFTADVLPHNAAMLHVFRRGDHDTNVTMEDGVCEIRMLFRQPREDAG